jgi:hypothetical protein
MLVIIAGIYTTLMFFSACSSWLFKILFLNIAAVTSLVWSKISSVSAYPTIFLFRFWYQLFIWQMCCRVVERNLTDDVAHLISSRELNKALHMQKCPKSSWIVLDFHVTMWLQLLSTSMARTYWWDWRENSTALAVKWVLANQRKSDKEYGDR